MQVDIYFKILGSSSSGNAAVLRTTESTILIDAGLSCKKLTLLLKKEGIDIEELDAVFLTHEHNDHSAGIRGLSKYGNLPIYANQDTVQAIQAKLPRRPNWKIFETGSPFSFRSFKVHPFSVPHDAYDPVGFYFEWGKEDLFDPPSSLAWVTDLGYVPALVKERIRQARILVKTTPSDHGASSNVSEDGTGTCQIRPPTNCSIRLRTTVGKKSSSCT